LYGDLEKRGHYIVTYNQKPSFQQIYQNFNIFFFISFLGIIPILRQRKNYQLLILLWFLLALFGVYNKIEFIFVFSFSLVMMAALFFDELKNVILSSGKLQKYRAPLLVILMVLIIVPVHNQYTESKSLLNDLEPTINDNWISALRWLKNNSEKDSVVLCWFDYGFATEYLANRGSVADGVTTYGFDRIYDTSLFYLSTNEEDALKITDKYSVDYVIADFSLYHKLPWIAYMAGVDKEKFYNYERNQFTGKGENTMVFKMLFADGEGLSCFKKVHDAGYVKIYEVVQE